MKLIINDQQADSAIPDAQLDTQVSIPMSESAPSSPPQQQQQQQQGQQQNAPSPQRMTRSRAKQESLATNPQTNNPPSTTSAHPPQKQESVIALVSFGGSPKKSVSLTTTKPTGFRRGATNVRQLPQKLVVTSSGSVKESSTASPRHGNGRSSTLATDQVDATQDAPSPSRHSALSPSSLIPPPPTHRPTTYSSITPPTLPVKSAMPMHMTTTTSHMVHPQSVSFSPTTVLPSYRRKNLIAIWPEFRIRLVQYFGENGLWWFKDHPAVAHWKNIADQRAWEFMLLEWVFAMRGKGSINGPMDWNLAEAEGWDFVGKPYIPQGARFFRRDIRALVCQRRSTGILRNIDRAPPPDVAIVLKELLAFEQFFDLNKMAELGMFELPKRDEDWDAVAEQRVNIIRSFYDPKEEKAQGKKYWHDWEAV
ncbi:hypothetical protein HK102_009880, partial [Quaeritorhiza haematococci]